MVPRRERGIPGRVWGIRGMTRGRKKSCSKRREKSVDKRSIKKKKGRRSLTPEEDQPVGTNKIGIKP